MQLDGWMAITSDAEACNASALLHDTKMLDVAHTAPKHAPTACHEFTFTKYVDTDEDLVELVKVLLFYQDRSPKEIARIAKVLNLELQTNT